MPTTELQYGIHPGLRFASLLDGHGACRDLGWDDVEQVDLLAVVEVAQQGPDAPAMDAVAKPLGEAQARTLAARQVSSVVYGLRPEALRLSDRGLPGQLRMVAPTGPETYAYVDTAVGPMVLRVPGRVAQPVGSNVLLDWNEAEVHLFDGQTEQRIEVANPSAGAKVTPLYAQGA